MLYEVITRTCRPIVERDLFSTSGRQDGRRHIEREIGANQARDRTLLPCRPIKNRAASGARQSQFTGTAAGIPRNLPLPAWPPG